MLEAFMNAQLLPKILQSNRLQLRNIRPGDDDVLFINYFGSVEASQFLSRLPHRSLKHTSEFLSKRYDDAKLVGFPAFGTSVRDAIANSKVWTNLSLYNTSKTND